MISKMEFDVLCCIKDTNLQNEEIAKELFNDVDKINESVKNLEKKGFVSDGKLTSQAEEYISEHTIDNAIILAAGMSSRFVPLNYEIPKGLLEVKGERLIERQIKQLHEKGISEIIVVVGHMKEQFEYLKDMFGVILVETDEYKERNNHASVYAAREYLKNSIITSSDLYFANNIFQRYAYDAYYCTVYMSGKTAERGIITDEDDKIIETMYGDRCYDIWVTLGYAYFNERFSKNIINILNNEYDLPETKNKFWADIQDEHLDELYMYAKRIDNDVIYEFDSLEELREFDYKYLYNSGSAILKQICYLLAVKENNIVGIESLKKLKSTMFKFRCKGDAYVCDIEPDDTEKITVNGRVYYQTRDFEKGNIKLYKMDKNIRIGTRPYTEVDAEVNQLLELTNEFVDYHNRALPLCAAENVISEFGNIPLSLGFQERYIMNNTYSFSMEDNFIGCEKLFPFYEKLSDVCSRVFGAKYTDPRPFTGMHCIDMITKTICKSGDKIILLSPKHGGHASVKPVVERLGLITYEAPYDLEENDLDYEKINQMVVKEGINYILLAPSDIIKPLNVEKIDTTNCVLLYDCSQLMGLIAAGLISNPLKTMKNIILFGGTHKTFPGPASGLILTNDKQLHDMMEREINPKYLRHSQMHQKISLLFTLVEFEKFGAEYMSHMVHCSNYLGKKLKSYGFDIADVKGQISQTHQVFIRCSKEEMDLIYDNAYKCEVTLNKKHKDLFIGYGIRLGTQEIARYDWNDDALDVVAEIVSHLADKNIDIIRTKELIQSLPEKKIHYAFEKEVISKFC